jgi:hydrogenase-4 membrane subunit HyfE
MMHYQYQRLVHTITGQLLHFFVIWKKSVRSAFTVLANHSVVTVALVFQAGIAVVLAAAEFHSSASS